MKKVEKVLSEDYKQGWTDGSVNERGLCTEENKREIEAQKYLWRIKRDDAYEKGLSQGFEWTFLFCSILFLLWQIFSKQ